MRLPRNPARRGGRANLFVTEDCCVLVDDELLRQINVTASIVIATSVNFTFARAGQRVATVKSAPFAVSEAQLDAVNSILRERGPISRRGPSVNLPWRCCIQTRSTGIAPGSFLRA